MAKGFTEQDAALLDELGVEARSKETSSLSAREKRLIAGFSEIQKFVDVNSRHPGRGENKDIFERLLAVRLDRILNCDECLKVLTPLDRSNLLSGRGGTEDELPDDLDDDELLAELGLNPEKADITKLRHVRSSAEKRAAEEVASRTKCKDFDQFRPLFEKVQLEVSAGIRETRKCERKAEIAPRRFFIVGGLKAYVAEMGPVFTQQYGDKDARLRVIFDNGTESNMLRRSLQRALHKDPAGRRISDPSQRALFGSRAEENDQVTGTIYVLQSKSDHPEIAKRRELIHKIGVTGGDVEKRISAAPQEPTFLLADVEIVAKYRLYNIKRSKLERLIHRLLDSVRLKIEIKDRFGNTVTPREWFCVPLHVIDEVVQKIKDGTIIQYSYDAKSASLMKVAATA